MLTKLLFLMFIILLANIKCAAWSFFGRISSIGTIAQASRSGTIASSSFSISPRAGLVGPIISGGGYNDYHYPAETALSSNFGRITLAEILGEKATKKQNAMKSYQENQGGNGQEEKNEFKLETVKELESKKGPPAKYQHQSLDEKQPNSAESKYSVQEILFMIVAMIVSFIVFALFFFIVSKLQNDGKRNSKINDAINNFAIPLPAELSFDTMRIDAYNKIHRACISDESKIGGGHEGAVFSARYKPTNSQHYFNVAVKKLRPNNGEFTGDDIVREIDMLGRCSAHPNIVRLLGWYICGPDQLSVVTEYLTGGTLEQFIVKNGAICWQQALPLFKQICGAMCFLSQHGLVHRDLALRNLMFTDKTHRQLKLIDFGLCRRVGNLQPYIDHSQGHRICEPKTKGLPTFYTPPECIAARQMVNKIRANEQQNGKKILSNSWALLAPVFNEKTDVWAFGVIIWYCLAPAYSFDKLEQEKKQLEQTGELFESTISRIDASVHATSIYQTLVKPCLALNADHRPTFEQLSGNLVRIDKEGLNIVDEQKSLL